MGRISFGGFLTIRVPVEGCGFPPISPAAADEMDGAQSVIDPTCFSNLLFRGLRRCDSHFFQGRLAAGADILPDAVVGDLGHEVPAAGALVAGGGAEIK